jgi:hypothetical protein
MFLGHILLVKVQLLGECKESFVTYTSLEASNTVVAEPSILIVLVHFGSIPRKGSTST